MPPLLTKIIRGVRLTEKATRIQAKQQYVLDVAPDANKPQIKEAVEALFKVTVLDVQTQRYEGKWRRLTRAWGRRAAGKRAIVTLAEGHKIEVK